MNAVAIAATAGTAKTIIETVDFDRSVPAGEVPFPVMWEGRLYQLTGTPAAIGRAAEILLSGLPTVADLGISTSVFNMLNGSANIASVGMGRGDGQNFLTGNAALIMAFRHAMMR